MFRTLQKIVIPIFCRDFLRYKCYKCNNSKKYRNTASWLGKFSPKFCYTIFRIVTNVTKIGGISGSGPEKCNVCYIFTFHVTGFVTKFKAFNLLSINALFQNVTKVTFVTRFLNSGEKISFT